EVLVSDLLIEGLFVSYEMDLEVGLTNEDKDHLFREFIRKYMEVRKLSQDEINVMDDIYAVVFPFWWTRIIYDENQSLLSYLRANNNEKVDQFLKETYELLNHNYFSEFHWEGF